VGEVARIAPRLALRRSLRYRRGQYRSPATFVAIAQHVHAVRPDLGLAGPATLLLTGMLLSMASVCWLTAVPRQTTRRFPRVFERIASRDYIYLVVALTAVERLHWFVWAAALGANAFWLSLWWWTLGRRRR
jgi:hypothetical protein